MISLNQLKKTRSSVAALSTLIALQSLYAQSADAQVTFTSTISALTCTISINNASGQSTATVAIGNTSLASGAINVPQANRNGTCLCVFFSSSSPWLIGYCRSWLALPWPLKLQLFLWKSKVPDQRIRQQDIAAKLYPVWIE